MIFRHVACDYLAASLRALYLCCLCQVCTTCQAQYCSIGRWAGHDLRKVGEGLCSSRAAPTTHLNSLVLGGNGLFVGGAFSSLVWNGTLRKCINILVTCQKVYIFFGRVFSYNTGMMRWQKCHISVYLSLIQSF
jgi:hypothetical protein